jgi:Glycosyl transferase family 2/Methyltransferase domain
MAFCTAGAYQNISRCITATAIPLIADRKPGGRGGVCPICWQAFFTNCNLWRRSATASGMSTPGFTIIDLVNDADVTAWIETMKPPDSPEALLSQRIRRRPESDSPSSAPSQREHWCRVEMNRAAREFVSGLTRETLDVLEVSGTTWSDPGLGFRSYRSLAYPEYDICQGPIERNCCDLLILEQVLEHVRQPHRALANAWQMLRPGGRLLLNTPFLLKFHPCPVDLYRWTEDGLRTLLEEAGFQVASTGSWGNRECLAADMQPGMAWTYYDPAVHSLANETQFPISVWAFARKPAPAPPIAPSGRAAFGVMVLTKNGASRLGRCLESIARQSFAGEIVVCVDRDTTDESARIARSFTPLVHVIETGGSLESALPVMAAHCSAEFVLRVDDDETLGGNWDAVQLEALVRDNHLTHLVLPRLWLVPPEPGGRPRFIAGEPWFPDHQVRFFRNDPALIRWPAAIHEPVASKGRGMILYDRWIEHHDLVLNSRSERERKARRYRHLRPEKHLSNLYLYEDQLVDLLPATPQGYAQALEAHLSGRDRSGAPPGSPYSAGATIRFETGQNGGEYIRGGWSIDEPWGRWTLGHRADLRIPLERPFEGPALLTVEAGAFVRPEHPVLHVRVACNREPLGAWTIESADPVEHAMPIPASALEGRRELLLAFSIDNPAAPVEFDEFGDQRLLGMGFRSLRITAC